MARYQRKDHLHQKAKKEGLRSRAAYKLAELQQAHRLLRRGQRVVDLGCWPGGWLQVALEAVGEKGLVRVSSDGGLSWVAPEPENFPTVFTFMRDIGFENNQRVGMIVGQQGMVLRSQDGGRRWTRVLPKSDQGVDRVL